ncbi:ISSpo6, transposase orf A [Bosea sp. LC85]|jgi:transposase|nr:ISSpo6, transposase orf A [Bosea sp. LC85]
MGRSYSNDLRERVAGLVEAGQSRRAAARHFGVSESFAVKLLQRVTRLKTVRPARQGRPPGSRLDGHGAFLVAQVEAQPDMTMPELAARLAEATGVKAAPAVLSRFLCRLGFTYKKSADGVGMRSRRHS